MKKTIIQLLILITCFLGSHQVFAQKSKTTTGYAVKVDSFYFEKPATKNLYRIKKKNQIITALRMKTFV